MVEGVRVFAVRHLAEAVALLQKPEQFKPVPSYPSQDGVDRTSGELSVRGIKERTQQGHQKDQPAPPKSLGECLGIPGKERHRPDHGQVKQAALHPPVDGGAGTGIVVCRFQNCCSFLYKESWRSGEVPIVNN